MLDVVEIMQVSSTMVSFEQLVMTVPSIANKTIDVIFLIFIFY